MNDIEKGMANFHRHAMERLPTIPPAKPFEVTVEVQQFDTQPFSSDSRPPMLEDDPQQASGPTPGKITSVDPEVISTVGGTTVTINGSNFTNDPLLEVKFGGTKCTNVIFVNDTKITCVSPAHSVGFVDVDVTGAETFSNKLQYLRPPHIISIAPNFGPTGGVVGVVITGSDFSPVNTQPKVQVVPGTAFIPVNYTNTTITANFPSGNAGTYDVVVINFFGWKDTLVKGFTYGDPPPPPTGVGGTLSAPSWIGAPYNMPINTAWPFHVTSTGTAALQLRIRQPAFWSEVGNTPDLGLANVVITPSSVTPPGNFTVVVGTPYPRTFGDLIFCPVDLILVDPANPSVALPTYGELHQPYFYAVNAQYI